jgi:hypothetical protein
VLAAAATITIMVPLWGVVSSVAAVLAASISTIPAIILGGMIGITVFGLIPVRRSVVGSVFVTFAFAFVFFDSHSADVDFFRLLVTLADQHCLPLREVQASP